MENLVNKDEFEKVLLVNWTKFINPQRMISFILSNVRDTNLVKSDRITELKQKSVQITLSQFRPTNHGSFIIWADFIIPKKEGLAVGTCELSLEPVSGSIKHLQTLGTVFQIGGA
jgi:hypothetical protein